MQLKITAKSNQIISCSTVQQSKFNGSKIKQCNISAFLAITRLVTVKSKVTQEHKQTNKFE